MNEEPDNKPHWRFSTPLLIWLVFFTGIAGVLTWIDADAARFSAARPPYWQLIVFTVVGATLALVLFLFARWDCCWKNFRRVAIALAVLVTLYAAFCTVENWRGKRVWLACKAELEAKGAVLDWNKHIPPPVPDDQNFFTVNTNFYLRFVKLKIEEQGLAAKAATWLNLTNGFPIVDLEKLKPVVADITVVLASDAKAGQAISLRDGNAAEQLQAALRRAVGRDAVGSAGFKFTEFQISNRVPAQIVVLADSLPTISDLEKLIPATMFTNIGKLAIATAADPNIFQVRFINGRVTAATDYLAWGDERYRTDLDDVRAALQRPYAVIPGDYSFPPLMPIPNFVLLRNLAQTLAQRAQCDLLLGQPERAQRELALIHDVCRILQKPPTGEAETLVEAMINVAITGVYVATVQEGFRLHAWQEPQLAAIQKQLNQVDLLPWILRALRMKQCYIAYLGENLSFRFIFGDNNRIWGNAKKQAWYEQLLSYRYDLIPHGWLYQNLKFSTELDQSMIDSCDFTDGRIHPRAMENANNNLEKQIKHRSPFRYLAAIAMPNYTKAMQTAAYNQTLANQAQIVCALERFKLAHGNYPATLSELMPEFIEKIPHDIVGGEPLHYQRTADGKFLLYSIGWNETDDGGVIAKDKSGSENKTQGDWVWKN